MSTYTKYHRKYQQSHKSKINAYKQKYYYYRRYGIPLDKYDEYIHVFNDNRQEYIKLAKMLSLLDATLLRVIINKVLYNGDKILKERSAL